MKAFQFAPGLSLRVIDRDGEPWFVATDVCAALQHKNTTVAMRALDDDEQAKLNLGVVGGPVNVVSESGLYALTLRSRKPHTRAFRKWVTSEVLPAIRKNGGYMAPSVAALAVESPAEFMARALVMANETIQGLQAATKGLEAVTPEGEKLTLRDWLAEVGLNKLPMSERIKLGTRARSLGDIAGRPREYAERPAHNGHGGLVTTRAGIHSRAALERAAASLHLQHG